MSDGRLEKWSRTVVICVMFGFVALTSYQCAEKLGDGVGVTIYDGFRHKCEQAGGLEVDGVCLSTENLIELSLEGKDDEQ